MSDPLPQALTLTAIVITFGVTAFLLALAYRSWLLTSDDEVEHDLADLDIRLGLGGQEDDADLLDLTDDEIDDLIELAEADAGDTPDASDAPETRHDDGEPTGGAP